MRCSYIKAIITLLLAVALLLPCVLVRTDAASSAEIAYFLETIGPMATQDMRETGILASLTIAQGIYESGWGTSWMAKNINNLFGIKAYDPAWQGKVYCRKTGKIYTDFADAKNKLGSLYKEYVGQFFRVYNSWEESLKDHSTLFTTMSRYENLVGLTDYKLACRYVKEDGYCDSDGYDDMLITFIEKYKLYIYDVADGVTSVKMNVDALSLGIGDSIKVYPSITTADGSTAYLQFRSGNTAVATVDDEGNITGVSQGAALITVSATNGMKDTAIVYVHDADTVLRVVTFTNNVNCRSESNDTGGSATVLGSFVKGTKAVVFGDAVRTKWYNIAGMGSKNELLFGYSYGSYFTIGDEFTGDTPVDPHADDPEPVSEEVSEDVSEAGSEDVSEEVSQETSEPVSEEPAPYDEPTEDTGLYIGELSGDVNCRKGPSLDESSTGVFAKGAKVLVIGEAINTRWYHCTGVMKNGRIGDGYAGFKTSDGKTTYISIIGGFTDTAGVLLRFTEENVYGIAPGTTVGSLASCMTYAGITVLSPQGTELGESDLVCTGTTIQFKWCDTVYLTRTAVILGDVNCDGMVDAGDCASLKRYLLGTERYSGVQLRAARFSGGDAVSVDDYMALRLYLMGQ